MISDSDDSKAPVNLSKDFLIMQNNKRKFPDDIETYSSHKSDNDDDGQIFPSLAKRSCQDYTLCANNFSDPNMVLSTPQDLSSPQSDVMKKFSPEKPTDCSIAKYKDDDLDLNLEKPHIRNLKSEITDSNNCDEEIVNSRCSPVLHHDDDSRDLNPETPSSGFIEVEADTPPASPLNHTTNINSEAITATSLASSSRVSDGYRNNIYSCDEDDYCETRTVSESDVDNQDSAVDLEIDTTQQISHDGRNIATKFCPPHLTNSVHDDRLGDNIRAQKSESNNSNNINENSRLGETKLFTNKPKPESQQNNKRIKFSIDAILGPDFGVLTNTNYDQHSCQPHSQQSNIESKVGVYRPHTSTGHHTISVSPPQTKQSAFTAVDLRTRTRPSSVSSPSPSSRSSAPSSPCSGTSSPPLSSSSLSPTFSRKDTRATSKHSVSNHREHPDHKVSKKQANVDARSLLQNISHSVVTDPKKLLFPAFYNISRVSEEKLRDHNLGINDADKLSSSKNPLVPIPQPNTATERFPKHLAFMPPFPSLSHSITVPLLQASLQQFHYLQDRHLSHHHQQQKDPHNILHHKIDPFQQALLSPVNPLLLRAPPIPDPSTRLQAESLRIFHAAGYPAFIPGQPLISPTEKRPTVMHSPTNPEDKLNWQKTKQSHYPVLPQNTKDVPNLSSSNQTDKLQKLSPEIELKPYKQHSDNIYTNPLHSILAKFNPDKLFTPTEKTGPSHKNSLYESKNSSQRKIPHCSERHPQKLVTKSLKEKHDEKYQQDKTHHQSHNSSSNNSKLSQNLENTNPACKMERNSLNREENSSTMLKQEQPNNRSDDSTEAKDGKEAKGDNSLYPAWVFCTRYSDRPSSETRRKSLADQLGLTESQIKIWFQNKRAKIKKSHGAKNPLAQQLMEQGLYNHSTVKADD